MAKMMWKSNDVVFIILICIILCLSLCLSAPEDTGKDSEKLKNVTQEVGNQPKTERSKADKTEVKEEGGKTEGKPPTFTDGVSKNQAGDKSTAKKRRKSTKRPKDDKGTVIEPKNLRPDSSTSTSNGGGFMTYFIASAILLVIIYVAFHNRHKILAYIVEGRRSRSTSSRRRVASSGGATSVEYRPLNNTAAEELLNPASELGGSGAENSGKPEYMY